MKAFIVQKVVTFLLPIWEIVKAWYESFEAGCERGLAEAKKAEDERHAFCAD